MTVIDIPVAFLDIDEVICHTRAKMAGFSDSIDPVAVGMLKRILNDTGARIVVTSTWRSSPDSCAKMFDTHGLTPYLWSPIVQPDAADFDPARDDWRVDSNNHSRAGTVQRWLAAHSGVTRWIIIDDSLADFSPQQLGRLVHADMVHGLGYRQYSRAIRLLNGPRPIDDGNQDNLGGQYPRYTIANLASQARAALDQGDHDTALAILDAIHGHPLAQ